MANLGRRPAQRAHAIEHDRDELGRLVDERLVPGFVEPHDLLRRRAQNVEVRNARLRRNPRIAPPQKQHDRNIPSFAKKIVGDTIHIVQREQWSDDRYATLDVTIPGKPGHVKGTITLAPNGGGTVETVSGEVKVHVPLVGGKLEKLIEGVLESALRNEEKVGRTWLERQ
jgi:hypothetical protein